MSSTGPRLLIVDDDRSLRLTLAVLLEEEGFEVAEASSCAEALAQLEACRGSLAHVLLDQHLGDGSGLDLLPAVRTHQAQAIVVLLTGSRPPEHLIAGLDACIVKGGAFDELVAQLRALAAAPRSR